MELSATIKITSYRCNALIRVQIYKNPTSDENLNKVSYSTQHLPCKEKNTMVEIEYNE